MPDYSLVSVDVETTGPTPSTGELLSVGAVFLDEDLNLEAPHYTANIALPPIPKMDKDTTDWWKQWPEQWAECSTNCIKIKDAMWKLVEWTTSSVPGKPLFVAWPVGFDWGFINYNLHLHTGDNPFGYSPLCLKNYAAGLLRNPKMLTGTREEAYMPEGWLVKPEDIGLLPHIALNDAIAQAHMIHNIMRWTG
jgi:DNA polymerase III epsilon subunit-like protein